jgi:TRAP-type mannitol/chloroaromatic compound transport system substrate-binding protein
MINLKTLTAGAVGLTMLASTAMAEKVLRIQSVLPSTADEVFMLNDFGKDVAALTGGSLTIEVLPAGAVVGPRDIMDAVDAGLVEGGFAWTHYWGGKHVAANLFGAPVGGGRELYDQLWDEMGVNVKGFMLQPVGPEALGWFPKPIKSMDDFRQMRFRAPPGMVGAAYADIGVPAVAMGGGDILPALEKGTIDAAEWCCPKPDSVFGFQKVLKHYYLQGLHQVTVNADMYVNGDFYDGLTDIEKKALEVAANASLSKSLSYRIYENGKALKDLTDNHGVILEDTPADYFTEYSAAANKALQAAADENAFFAEVWQSQKDFATIAVPFWSGAQTSNANLGRAFADTLK